jgi:hypothetical protein
MPNADDPLRPVAPRLKWWLVGAVILLLGAWQVAFHLWFMHLPMLTGHRLNSAVGGLLVALTLLAALSLVQVYEERLAAGTRILWESDQRLRKELAARNQQILDRARVLRQIANDLAGGSETSPGGALPARRGSAPADPPACGREIEAIAASLEQMLVEERGETNVPLR